MESLRALRARAVALRKNLSLKMEELKKFTESKATTLEIEVCALREEVESLRTLLEIKEEGKQSELVN